MNNSTCLLLSLILSLVFLFPYFASPSPLNSLPKGSYLSVEEASSSILVSADGSFSCGFYKIGSNAYTFSVWFSKSTANTTAWTANRDHPVNGHGSRIMFHKDGGVVLTDTDGTVVWSTNTSSTKAEQMMLLDSGNLVIVNADDQVLWQSFDSPTDTLLPTQPITKNTKLISSITSGGFSSGYYSFHFNDDNVLNMIYDGPEISSVYYPNPDYNVFQNGRTNYNSSRYGVLDDEGVFVASDRMGFNASDRGLGIRRRLTLDYDGNLRLYSLNESNGSWLTSWHAFPKLCSIHGLCGRNGICIYTPVPQCSCPPGYEMADSTDWNRGCNPKIDISCNGTSSQKVEFVQLLNTDFWGYDLNYTQSISLDTCKEICLRDCQCQAFGYRGESGDCYAKNALFNGRTQQEPTPNTIYLKVPSITQDSNPAVSQLYLLTCNATDGESRLGSLVVYGISSNKFKWAYLYLFLATIFVVEVLFVTCGWWFIFRKGQLPSSVEEGYKAISSQFRKFTYKDLQRATGKFKHVVGTGGSGTVYKGILDDERVVAVKKLEGAIQGEEEFWAEVSVIGRIYHMNLVRIWGFCSESAHKLLVSEYVENGSLAKVLFDSNNETNLLDWKKRFKIAVAVAKGLAYLHHECLEWVIHCDIKPENILLDKDFEPKIADFGLAKLLKRDGGGSDLLQIRGTRGYIAPEWASSLPITGKVDVYSYGVVLLELVKGSRVSNWMMDWVGEEEEVELVIRKLCLVLKKKLETREESSWIENFVDGRLNGQFNFKQVVLMVEIAVSCLEEQRNKRPTMDSVVQMLLSCDDQDNFNL